MLVGFCSIGLCAVAWFGGSSRGIRYAVVAVLVGVIVQGLLGGLRVRLDRQVVAFGHSVFGCLVFVSLWMVSSATSRHWSEVNGRSSSSRFAWFLAWSYPLVVLIQYVFGGVIRHLGSMLHAHLVGAALVLFDWTLCCSMVWWQFARSSIRSCRCTGRGNSSRFTWGTQSPLGSTGSCVRP